MPLARTKDQPHGWSVFASSIETQITPAGAGYRCLRCEQSLDTYSRIILNAAGFVKAEVGKKLAPLTEGCFCRIRDSRTCNPERRRDGAVTLAGLGWSLGCDTRPLKVRQCGWTYPLYIVRGAYSQVHPPLWQTTPVLQCPVVLATSQVVRRTTANKQTEQEHATITTRAPWGPKAVTPSSTECQWAP